MLNQLLNEIKVNEKYLLFIKNLDYTPEWLFEFQPYTIMQIPTPPAFIPTMDSSDSRLNKKGIIKHWFQEREVIYTTIDIERCKTYKEEARTFETFITKVLFDWIMVEEELTLDIKKFADLMQYDQLDNVYAFFKKYQDLPCLYASELQYFNRLRSFKPSITPIEYIEYITHYTGNFATSSKGFVNVSGIYTATTFEIQDVAKPIVDRLKNLPDWLKKGANQKYLFDQYVEKNELDKAWLTLNSTGWKLDDVANALEILTKETDETGFDTMVEYWMQNWKNSYFYKDILEY